jgi:hypothetical protein
MIGLHRGEGYELYQYQLYQFYFEGYVFLKSPYYII